MEAPDFIRAGERLYGQWGWKTQLADKLDMSRNTITKYAQGKLRIPRRVELALRELENER